MLRLWATRRSPRRPPSARSLLRRKEHGRLAKTVKALTGGGGRHLYFAHPGDIMRNRVGIAPGVDLRGDGGYVVAPPPLDADEVVRTVESIMRLHQRGGDGDE